MPTSRKEHAQDGVGYAIEVTREKGHPPELMIWILTIDGVPHEEFYKKRLWEKDEDN